MRAGGSLKEIPPHHRRDEVCFYATLHMPIDRSLPSYRENGSVPFQQWVDTVLPHIPIDVLYMTFVRGGVPFELMRQNDLFDNKTDEAEAAARMRAKRRRGVD